jgi:hypothetical protein
MDLEILHPREGEELDHESSTRSETAYIAFEALSAAGAVSLFQLIDTAGGNASA